MGGGFWRGKGVNASVTRAAPRILVLMHLAGLLEMRGVVDEDVELLGGSGWFLRRRRGLMRDL